MPALLGHFGLGDQMPRKPESPGRDFAAALRGKPIEWDDVMFYEFETTRAIRTADWKLIRRHATGPHELYNLQADPGELTNLAALPEHQNRIRTMHDALVNELGEEPEQTELRSRSDFAYYHQLGGYPEL